MTAEILHFIPRAEIGTQGNLESFIQLCRGSSVLDARDQFDSNHWSAGYRKGRRSAGSVRFCTWEGVKKGSGRADAPPLPQPFIDFAKAVIVYMHDKRPVINMATRITALRVLEAALRGDGKGSRPTAATGVHFDAAVDLARERLKPNVTYGVAGQLELIAELMRSKGLIEIRQAWVNPEPHPDRLGSRISEDALRVRQEKLPSATALGAIGQIFQDSVEPVDITVSSILALMLCAPERVNEVLRLRQKCRVEGDGRFAGKFGLRWPGSKGAPDTTKWLPSSMVDVAREAINNLLKASEPARRIAAWYTANPTSLYLEDSAEHLRAKPVLTLDEIGEVLWAGRGADRTSANLWAQRTKKLSPVSLGGNRIGFRFADVERAVLDMLPPTFPYVPGDEGLRCEDALCLLRRNESSGGRPTYVGMFECVGYNLISNNLQTTGRDSIFERFGFREDDGSPIELNTHALRHYLNMLSQLGGLSDTEIAIFSGRADIRQNRAYDHRSSDEVQAPVSKALKQGFTSELVAGGSRTLARRSDFNALDLTAAHVTDYGYCRHSFASEPCQMYRDCLNCEEQECVKGEAHKEANLRRRKAEIEYLLEQAKQALAEAEYGADAWVKHQTLTLERITGLLAVIDDPSRPAGTRIRLDIENASVITDSSVKVIKVYKRTNIPVVT